LGHKHRRFGDSKLDFGPAPFIDKRAQCNVLLVGEVAIEAGSQRWNHMVPF
jgi:hypothetical protein